MNVGRLNESRIHAPQCRGDHHVSEWRQSQSFNETDSDESCDVQRSGLKSKELHQKNVNDPDARVQKKYPAHRLKKGRKKNAAAQQTHGQNFMAQVGPLDEPCEQKS